MTDQTSSESRQPRWQPLSAIDRRVAGVLAEKAKTTPDAYPMSLKAVIAGCNQKSNRHPRMDLEPDEVGESLDRLRKLGAVGLVEGYGRVAKYRHYLYDWLGAEKVELAVMAELLLRGAQTVGELRGRAARMEPIRDMAQLEPVLDALESKGLLIPLTRKGRGQVVTHALYQPGELDRLKAQYSAAAAHPRTHLPEQPSASVRPVPTSSVASPPPAVDTQATEALARAIDELRRELVQLRNDLHDLADAQSRTEDDLQRLRGELGA